MNPLYSMPDIITETSDGISRHSLQDELFKDRQIELVGDINAESAYSAILQLRYLQKLDPKKEISLYINSPGGEVASGLALYDDRLVRQVLECIVVESKERINVIFAGGLEVEQQIQK